MLTFPTFLMQGHCYLLRDSLRVDCRGIAKIEIKDYRFFLNLAKGFLNLDGGQLLLCRLWLGLPGSLAGAELVLTCLGVLRLKLSH